MSKKNVAEKVRHLLWAKSAGRCHLCNEVLYRDEWTQIETNFADVAHIIGVSSDGPRGNRELSADDGYINNVDNLMLLCQKHHRLIDRFTRIFSEDYVRTLKKDHEDRISLQTAVSPERKSHLVIYRGNIGGFQPGIDYQDAKSSMFPDYYRASHRAIELGMLNSQLHDHEDEFWRNETTNLERQFNLHVEPLLGDPRDSNHFSVFAYAPMPLLIKLGSLLPDIYPAQVYQLHKVPPTWNWQPGLANVDYTIDEPTETHELVALNVSLSADISIDRIYQALQTEAVSIWNISVSETDHPKNDCLRSREQLELLSKRFRELFDRINTKHGLNTVVQVFPAMPVAAAVEFGRVRQQKVDTPILIYDQNKAVDGFYPTINII